MTLRYGHYSPVDGSVLRMSLYEVMEDSRCPTDAMCVWEGNARILVSIDAGDGSYNPLELNTSLEPTSATWKGIRVSIVELTPLPLSDVTISHGDYRVTLRLERD